MLNSRKIHCTNLSCKYRYAHLYICFHQQQTCKFKIAKLHRKVIKLECSGNGVALAKCSILYSNDNQHFKFGKDETPRKTKYIHNTTVATTIRIKPQLKKKYFSSGWKGISLE